MTTPALLAAALLLGAAPDPASPPLGVAPFGAAPQLSFSARRAAEEVARALASDGVAVLGPDRAEARLGRERTELLAACGADAHCLAGAAAPLGVERVLGGELQQGEGRYRARLVLVRVKDERVLGSVERDLPLGTKRLQAELAEVARRLLRGGEAPAAARPDAPR
ncbi:hypothetical protein [Anaeromyxobacter paludicola]|uniref:DUF2380 domain-containing protein n=1 Tax=Anaeromyxobacter paludicola TaxID=2918171 RepID=A0ABN6ND64_9BACT|nr:hypothetical protein [Anaeromyxobacter paludicola]BDG09913.1 hypothetical protein AMPC_30260 [Anaeromyxobacter paludicola]